MIRINLLPVKAAQKRERFIGQIVVMTLALLFVVLACGGVEYYQQSEIDSAKAEINRKQAEINALKQKIGEVGRFKKLQQELQAKLDTLDKLKKDRTGPVKFLDELNRILPDKVWITLFKQGGRNITLEGIGLDEERVASFMRALEDSPLYAGVELRQTDRINQDGIWLQKFFLTCHLQ